MKFYVTNNLDSLNYEVEYPCFTLVNTNWDDYSYKTTFYLTYYSLKKERTSIGIVKIMDLSKEEDWGKTVLDESFEQLDDERYCSLGSNLSYYQHIVELFDEGKFDEILGGLNDVVWMPGLIDKFENTKVFQSSLLRERESKSAFILGASVLRKIELDPNIHFKFSTKLEKADLEHEVVFNFSKDANLQKRVFAIIGKNGTGKTQFIANLANALSITKDDLKKFDDNNARSKPDLKEYETGNFDSKLGPPFSKVIALSYSLFDSFKRPKPSKKFSYIYCGIRNEDDKIDKSHLRKRHLASLKQIYEKNRGENWYYTLKKFIDIDLAGYKFTRGLNRISNWDELENSDEFSLSSGQSMLVYTLTELIANLSKNSLVLFDEPENHLHPNAIANLINSINELVVDYDAFAIISTHSPLVVQEIPANNVWVFEREENTPITRPLDIESYGENLTTITKHIFETYEVEDGYKSYLDRLSQQLGYQQILDLFGGRLSLNAQLFLSSLYIEK